MSKPAFIVDGFTEKLILGSICPGSPVSRTDLNGNSVTLDAIAKKVSSLIRLFNNRYYPIIVVIDRENRSESSSEICSYLLEKLHEMGLSDQDIRIGVADRMIENWIISDWSVLESNNSKPDKTDGSRGSSIIKTEKGTYGKTTDGVELFLKANPQIMYTNSESFKQFADMVNDIACEFIINIEYT